MVILGSSVDGRELAMPALQRAFILQQQAASVGLDWPEADSVWSRINEELAEAKAACEDVTVLGSRLAARLQREGRNRPSGRDSSSAGSPSARGSAAGVPSSGSADARTSGVPASEAGELNAVKSLLVDEMGDLLFAVVDVCRTLHVDPSEALQGANDRFQACFKQLQRRLCLEGRLIGLESPERLKELWIEARRTACCPEPVPLWLLDEEEADVRGNLA